jgi:hypothetical protein
VEPKRRSDVDTAHTPFSGFFCITCANFDFALEVTLTTHLPQQQRLSRHNHNRPALTRNDIRQFPSQCLREPYKSSLDFPFNDITRRHSCRQIPHRKGHGKPPPSDATSSPPTLARIERQGPIGTCPFHPSSPPPRNKKRRQSSGQRKSRHPARRLSSQRPGHRPRHPPPARPAQSRPPRRLAPPQHLTNPAAPKSCHPWARTTLILPKQLAHIRRGLKSSQRTPIRSD